MKKLLSLLIAVLAMTATFTSCENDAPEINFSHTDTYTADYSGIIAAINSQSKSIEEKLALINSAIEAQTLTLSQKIDILNAAVENGVLTLQEMTQKLYDVITAQTTTLSEKLTAIQNAVDEGFIKEETQLKLIYTAITEQTTTLKERLAAIEKAVTDGFVLESQKLDLIYTAVTEQTSTLKERLAAIEKAVTDGFVLESQKLDLMYEAITAQTKTLDEKLTAIENTVDSGFIKNVEAINVVAKAVNDHSDNMTTLITNLQKAIETGNSYLKTTSEQTTLIASAVSEFTKKDGGTFTTAMENLQKVVNDGLLKQNETLQGMSDLIKSFVGDGTTKGIWQQVVEGLQTSVEKGFASQADAIEAFQKAVQDFIGDGTNKGAWEKAIEALNTAVEKGFASMEDAIETMSTSNGIYENPNDNSALYITPTAWDALAGNDEMRTSLAKKMTVKEYPNITGTVHEGATGCNAWGSYNRDPYLFKTSTMLSQVPGTNIEKTVIECVAYYTKKQYIAWFSSKSDSYCAYFTDVYGTRVQHTLTYEATTSDNTYRYTYTSTLYNKTTDTWTSTYNVYATAQ